MSSLISVRDLVKTFTLDTAQIEIIAVASVSFDIEQGTTLGLVGESGSGKSTVGRCLLRLLAPTSGSVVFEGTELSGLKQRQVRPFRSRMQMVFQDPYESLNPRMRIIDLIEEPLKLSTDLDRPARHAKIAEILDHVRLQPEHLRRYPKEMSGGQLQRVGIARAIATDPRFVVLDEPTSSLDLSVQAGVLDLLRRLQDELGMTYLLISHDLNMVASYCDDVAVMYLGSIVEYGSADQVFNDPQHPYTQALLSAALPADPEAILSRHMLHGEIPSPIDRPSGCPFASRCPLVMDACEAEVPHSRDVGDGHWAACIRIDDETNKLSVTPKQEGRESE